MKVPFYDLAFTGAEKAAVVATLESGWVTSGPSVTAFENAVAEYVGAPYAVALSSATAGLHLALVALGIGKGNEVIVPSYTFAASVSVILHVGARPVLCDSDPETLTIDCESVERLITSKTRAVMAVDIAGLPCDYARLTALCKRHRLRLICDAAHSLGASYRGQKVGSFGDATVFSFYSTKNITTGEGGMLVTANATTAKKVRLLALHGMTSAAHGRQAVGAWRYDISMLGFKYNLSDINAALGGAQMKRLPDMLARRKALAVLYTEGLAPYREFVECPPVLPGFEQAWHLYIVKLRPNALRISRDQFIQELSLRDIGASVHYVPIHRLSYFRRTLKVRPATLVGVNAVAPRVVSLPLYPTLSSEQVSLVCKTVGEIVRKNARTVRRAPKKKSTTARPKAH